MSGHWWVRGNRDDGSDSFCNLCLAYKSAYTMDQPCKPGAKMSKPGEMRTLREILAHILDALPDIDPHDDEAVLVDLLLPRFTEVIRAERLAAAGAERERCAQTLDIFLKNLNKVKSIGAPWVKDAADTIEALPDASEET